MSKHKVEITFEPVYEDLFKPYRYKVCYGGRGGGKSWAIGRSLLIQGAKRPLRILCAREVQNSIADSVHFLLVQQIDALGLRGFYKITQNEIRGANGTVFFYKGLRSNIQEIKSTEGIDIAWIEEAQSVSEESWQVLIPTVRKEGSEIWISFNPREESDPTYKRFVVNTPPHSAVHKVSWRDNPFFPDVLKAEKDFLERTDRSMYLHVWEGEPLRISNAVIFKGRYEIAPFETPEGVRFYHGVDWGFANDPTTLIRCFIKDRRLYIDREAYGVGVELDETAQLFDSIDTARRWALKADSARPETISYMRRQGFNISAAKKWQGSVEDGIAYLKSFEKIIIHPRCKHTADEFDHYSYKVDKQTNDILPVVVDANNHCIDGIRYALDGLITNRRAARITNKPEGF